MNFVRRALCVLAIGTVAGAGVGQSSEDSDAAELSGNVLGDFTLQDYLGAKHSFSEWRDKKAIVVVFLGTECPLAKLYGQRLVEMHQQYGPLGVQFVGINSNRQDTLAEMAHYARVHKIEFPLLKDAGQQVADQFGATRTPEAFILDSKGVVRYWGRIDDQYGVGYSRQKSTQRELAAALEQLLNNEPIAVPKTTAVGCIIGRAAQVEPTGDITYSKQISRLVQKRCRSCHREDQIAPFALSTYDDVANWAEMMQEVMENGRMPPWHANPAYGHFLNDARMSAKEKSLFSQWLKNGRPEGDPADLPAPLKFAKGWRIPQPSAVYRMPTAYQVPAKGVVPYQYFMLDPGFTEDKWVVASEVRPGNRSVVHHLILFFIPPEQKVIRGEDALFNAIAIFVPGMPPSVVQDGLAMHIPAGSKLVFQAHYTPNGSPQTDLSEVGLIFAEPDQVEKELETEAALNFRFLILPGAKNHRVEATYDIQYDASLHALTPHMHYRGKSFQVSAKYPDGKQEILLEVPEYDFNWQSTYFFSKPKFLPSGTRLELVAHYDNSADNLANPDPTATVHWGDQTWDEMMVGMILLSRAEQDLRLGPPQVEKLEGDLRRVSFRYRPVEPVKNVYLAGSFNDWKETGHRMEGPDDQGMFTTSIDLPSGEYEYKFVLDGKTWKNDPGNRQFKGFYQNSVVQVE